MILSADEVKGHLRNNFGIDPGFPHLPVFADSALEFVDEGWFYGDYLRRLGEFTSAFHPRHPWWQRLFRRDVFDCDDFTRGAAWFAQGAAWLSQVMHREEGKRIGCKAIAEFWYYRNSRPDDEHAMVMGMFSPDRIGFIEPITRQRGLWQVDEKCTWYRF